MCLKASLLSEYLKITAGSCVFLITAYKCAQACTTCTHTQLTGNKKSVIRCQETLSGHSSHICEPTCEIRGACLSACSVEINKKQGLPICKSVCVCVCMHLSLHLPYKPEGDQGHISVQYSCISTTILPSTVLLSPAFSLAASFHNP